jgi:hypothetical protein
MPSFSTITGVAVTIMAAATQVAAYDAVTINRQTWYGCKSTLLFPSQSSNDGSRVP